MLAEKLAEEGIPYELLNAKPENVERESEIVAQSGRRGAVTIATNMAGRGTDILLGGNPGGWCQRGWGWGGQGGVQSPLCAAQPCVDSQRIRTAPSPQSSWLA